MLTDEEAEAFMRERDLDPADDPQAARDGWGWTL